jgi:hypothetical protein
MKMPLVNNLPWFFSVALLISCNKAGTSLYNSLNSAPKPEGFLMMVDVTPDESKPGNFVVTCTNANGQKKQESHTRANIEKNEFCKLASGATVMPAGSGSAEVTAPNAAASAPTTQTSPSGQPKLPVVRRDSMPPGKVTLTLASTSVAVSFLKYRQGLDVSSNRGSLKEGQDYCALPKVFGADSICRVSLSEFRVTGALLDGCSLADGYVFAAHFQVQPSVVPACQ